MYSNKYIFILTLLFVTHFFAQNNNVQNINTIDGLPSNIINHIKQDNIGYIYFATEKGIAKYDGINLKQINTLKTNVLFTKENTLYAGLDNGLLIIKNAKSKILKSKKIVKIVNINNKIYLGTTQGIYKLENDYLTPLKINSAIDFSEINDIITANNSIYIATNTALWQLNSLDKPQKTQKLFDDHIVSVEKFQNDLIIATKSNNLIVLKSNSAKKTVATQNNILFIIKIKNELWVSSSKNGIDIYSLPSFTFKRKINKYNSLNTNVVKSIFKDTQNSVWIASNKGVYKFSEFNSQTSTRKNHKIYFENLQVNHQNADSLLTNTKIVKLAASDNNISIRFKTVDLLQPKNILYRYKLNDTFSPWSTNNQIHFTNLKAKKYTIQVQSKIKGSLSNTTSFSFIIDKPFFNQTWFIIASITFFLLIIYLILDRYLKKVDKDSKEKINQLKIENHLLSLEQKALQLQMNPHFIFNVLNGIKALGNAGRLEELNTSISQFSILLRSILSNSRKEEISLEEEINSLKNYIELEQKMNSVSFDFTINKNLNSIDADEILIPTMLIQPFVENSIKHGFKNSINGKIDIMFTIKHNFLECSIIDNGIGIHYSKKLNNNSNHNSIALKVSKERIQNISKNSAFYIDEIKENSIVMGTKVWFKIPLKTDY